MIRNYFKIAFRNLIRNRSHSIINLLGLAIGVACCLLIMLWVTDELSYEKWNDKADRTYRLTNEINFGGAHRHFAVSPAPLAEALRNDFPEVETTVRFRNYGSSLVKRDVQNFDESDIIYADSTLFDVFPLKMVSGDPKKALVAPNSVVINESIAEKYFPNEDPIGKTLTFDNRNEFGVTGVIEDMPVNSHFNYDFFVSLTSSEEAQDPSWVSNNFHTYYVLREDADAKAFEAKVFPFFRDKYISPQVQAIMGSSYEDFAKSGAFIKYHFQALPDIHLTSDLEIELAANGNIQYVWIFSLAALFILLIACVNFMNLSTARSANRSKEIGVRKVLGSMRSNLINQFLVEAVLMTAISFIIGIVIAYFALPYFNDLADKQLVFPYENFMFWGITIASIIGIGLLAGSYPAFYLSAFEPIKTLSGKLNDKGGNLNLRNSLVVFQFLIAAFLIIGTLVINRQMDFIQNKKLGYEREQLMILDNTSALGDRAYVLKSQLLSEPQINNVTVTGFLPIPSSRSDSPLCKQAEVREDNCVSMQMWQIDEDYIPTLGMELVSGRNFSPDMPTDSNAVIINETTARLLGFDDPVGKKLFGGPRFDPQNEAGMPEQTIIGVVKDFHFESLRENIGALSFWLNPFPGNITLKVETQDISSVINKVESSWKSVAPGMPFRYRFMDESFDRVYRSERRVNSIFNIFSGLSIFIACLGLFGLAAFTVERRVKEIGIRKVLGASTVNLVGLLSKDFLKLVLIALVIAIPLGWYFMKYWLRDYAYQAEIGWGIYVIAALLSIVIAFATVSFQSVKAALNNPVDSLKSE